MLALANHYQSGHRVSFDSVKIIHSEQNLKKRLITEALLICDNLTISGNTPSFNLQSFNKISKLGTFNKFIKTVLKYRFNIL